ncbi:protein LURP-one-related 5-like [Salvia miltiorrhiza]|uniref:protein LURP-one-related 5-like n=1 Tax=Salvia miltiorrhiza TaxID=226208 RepID=UPI0025AC3B7E|nr:protein LURP-one-related 5-like [Salvia miltiorrhiza]
MKKEGIVEEACVCKEDTHFTVMKTSVFFAGDGFTAFDSKGELIFRVDNYDGGDSCEMVLMDRAGRCILTVRRKRPSLHQRWEGFVGEGREDKALFSVRRSSMIARPTGMTVDVYSDPGEEYLIEGSFACRTCTVLNAERQVVAEIRRKVDIYANLVLSKDVFLLSVKRGFDSAFAMGLILILDQIHWVGFDFESDGVDGADPIQKSTFLPQIPRSFSL